MHNYYFETAGFRDAEEISINHMNGIEGNSLALSVKDLLASKGCQCEDVFEEDFGWATYVAVDGGKYFCTFSVDPADTDDSHDYDERVPDGTVMFVNINIDKQRSIKDKLLGRNRMLDDDPVSELVKVFLQGHPDCGELKSSLG